MSAAVQPGPQSSGVDLSRYSQVLHVDGARGDDFRGDGTRERPLATLMLAFERAGIASASKPIAILVAKGRYVQPPFVMRPHVDLYGGYDAFDGARDVYHHATILDGEFERRIAHGADHARLDGFHLVRGRVRGKGGALLCDATSPTIANCVFADNRTLIPQKWSPPQLHETANDGGAVMCLNGASPRFEHNLFYHNSTECGRGGAVAVDGRSAPGVVANVFVHNRAGIDDPMRSSDGGALSFFDWSRGEVVDNIVVANEALTHNDAGGIFVALWSAPRISHNIIVANECGDDAGGLFIGGQEHRYDAPLDAFPPSADFDVIVEGNVLVGNVNSSANSGATRITMESRARLIGNVIAENAGGLYLQRSEIVAERNTVWQDWRFLEDKASLGPSRFTGNVLKGPAAAFEARVTFSHNMLEPSVARGDNLPVSDIFLQDGLEGELVDFRFDAVTYSTVLTTALPLPPETDLARRIIRLSDSEKGGQWRVIRHASGHEIVVWGRLDAVTKVPKYFFILRTFTPKPDAPHAVGAPAR